MYFCRTNKCESGENAKYSQRAPGGGTGNYTFQGPFSQNLAVRPGLKFRELVNNTRTKPSTFFEKRSIRQFFSYYQSRQKSTFLPFVKNLSDRFNHLYLNMIIFSC